VDLELVADTDLAPLVSHLAASTIALRNSLDDGKRTVWLELEADPADSEEALGRFAALIESLRETLRHLWDRCDDRCFNIGIQAGVTPHASAFEVSPATIARLAALAVRLEMTLYGCGEGGSPVGEE
jgi:hypothetical protein